MHPLLQAISSWLCICRLALAVKRAFGSATQATFLLLSCLQFHVPFYASRTLPNVFAFGPVVLACAHWLDGSEVWLTPALLTAVTIITRCDMLLLAACASLALLATGRVPLPKLIVIGICSAAVALAATVSFDSVIWGRALWPEGEVLWFNTVLNKCVHTRIAELNARCSVFIRPVCPASYGQKLVPSPPALPHSALRPAASARLP